MKPRIRIYFEGGEPSKAYEVHGETEWIWLGYWAITKGSLWVLNNLTKPQTE